MRYIFLVLLFLTACSKKDETSSCTKQDTSSNRLVVSCFTKRSQYSTYCSRTTTNGAEAPAEVCMVGFDNNCTTGSINPQAIKPNVDSGTLVLIAKDTGAKLKFTTLTATPSGEQYIILQQDGDVGLTYSGNLPDCRTVNLSGF